MDLSELNGRWVLESVDGENVTSGDEEQAYFEITDQSITGYDGCNPFGGKINNPSAMRKKERGCPDTPLFPLNLSDPSSQLSRARIESDKLFLPLLDGKSEAQFSRVPKN
nr:META domain-containing protein [Nitrosomonas nitrosa]